MPLINPSGAVEAYRYRDNVANEHKILMRYEVGAGNLTTSFGDNGPASSSHPVSDLFWLSANEEYDVNSFSSLNMTMYFDNFGSSYLPMFSPFPLSLSSEGLTSGRGDTGVSVLTFEPFPLSVQGLPPTLDVFEPFICLSEGCYYQASMNLVGFSYQTDANGIARATFPGFFIDNQDLLFSQSRGFPGFGPNGEEAFDETLTLIVAPITVPEPSSLVLLSVTALAFSQRRRRRSNKKSH